MAQVININAKRPFKPVPYTPPHVPWWFRALGWAFAAVIVTVFWVKTFGAMDEHEEREDD
ncbi:MAG: hypothetical protein WA021_02500 [Minisyncoccia bacterium]